jgi:hypothetical protein
MNHEVTSPWPIGILRGLTVQKTHGWLGAITEASQLAEIDVPSWWLDMF